MIALDQHKPLRACVYTRSMPILKPALCVMGTRPEVIKMAPVVRALESRGIPAPVLATAQHRDLLDQVFQVFGLCSQWDLDAMRANQNLSELFARILPPIERIIHESQAGVVVAQGDTTTVLAAALAAYHARVPFAHVEAGLRSGDLTAPFPEEGNRRLAGVLTRFHFAPTETARHALLREGVAPDTIHVVGNTVIDSLLDMASRPDLPWASGVPPLGPGERLALITLHRRENFGPPLTRILASIRAFAESHPHTRFVYPVHPNPHVLGPAKATLGGLPNVHLIDPVDYPTLVRLLRDSHAVFTDSGGLQEEAPSLGKPVLVFRDVTERPEAVEAGGVLLVGSDPAAFRQAADRLWEDSTHYAAMAQPRHPYGDGRSSQRIASLLGAFLELA